MLISKRAILLAVLSCVAVSGCGRKGKRGDNSPGDKPGGDPVLRLSAADQKTFNEWRDSLGKTCDATAIFDKPNLAAEKTHLDGRVLLEKLNKSFVVKIDDKQTVWLDSPQGVAGVSESNMERTFDINGSASTVKVSAKRNGSKCEIFLFDELAYSTQTFAGVTIAAATPAQMNAQPAQGYNLSITTSADRSRASVAGMTQFYSSLQESLLPSQATQVLMAKKLGISDAQAKVWFPIKNGAIVNLASTVAIQNTDLPATNFRAAPLAGSTTSINNLLASRKWDLRFYFVPLRIKAGDIENTNDQGLWTVAASFDVDRNAAKMTLLSASNEGLTPFDHGKANSCFMTRLSDGKALGGLAQSTSLTTGQNYNFPAEDSVVSACEIYSQNFSEALLSNQDALSAWRQIYVGTFGSSVAFRGWDGLMKAMLVAVNDKNQDLNATLNPNSNMPIVSSTATNLKSLNDHIKPRAKLEPFAKRTIDAAASWSINGENIDTHAVQKLAQALEHIIVPFDAAAERLFSSAVVSLKSAEDDIDFALAVSEDYKNDAMRARDRAKTIGVETAIEASMANVIANKSPQSLFAQWNLTLDALTPFKDRETIRLGKEDSAYTKSSHESAFAKVATNALAQGWMAADFETLEKITAYRGAVDSFCSGKKTASALAVDCVRGDILTVAPGKMLAREFGGRYGNLANDFAGYHNQLKDSYGLQSRLDREFMDPIWLKCSNEVFAQRAQTLRDQVARYLVAEFSEEYKIQREIEAGLEDCR